jgi:hypothetical protein
VERDESVQVGFTKLLRASGVDGRVEFIEIEEHMMAHLLAV